MVLGFGERSLWFDSRPNLKFLPCIYSFVSLLQTLFGRRGAAPGLAKEPLILFNVTEKKTLCLIGFPSSIKDKYGRPLLQAIQYLTTTLERILFSSGAMVLAFGARGLWSNPVLTLYFYHAFIHLCLCYRLSS